MAAEAATSSLRALALADTAAGSIRSRSDTDAESTTNPQSPASTSASISEAPSWCFDSMTDDSAIEEGERARPLALLASASEFMALSESEKLRLTRISDTNVAIEVRVRGEGTQAFRVAVSGVPLFLLHAFSGVALRLLELPHRPARLHLTGVEPSNFRMLVRWAMSICIQGHLHPVPVRGLSCEEWMVVWKTAQTLEMPLALETLSKSLFGQAKGCNAEDTIACYEYALEYHLPVPETVFHRRLWAYATDKLVDMPLSTEGLDLLVRHCNGRAFVTGAVQSISEFYFDEGFSIKAAIEDLGDVCEETKSAVKAKLGALIAESKD